MGYTVSDIQSLVGSMFGAVEVAVADTALLLMRFTGARVEDHGGNAAVVLAVLGSLAACWVAYTVMARCRISLKLRRMSKTVPCVRCVRGNYGRRVGLVGNAPDFVRTIRRMLRITPVLTDYSVVLYRCINRFQRQIPG